MNCNKIAILLCAKLLSLNVCQTFSTKICANCFHKMQCKVRMVSLMVPCCYYSTTNWMPCRDYSTTNCINLQYCTVPLNCGQMHVCQTFSSKFAQNVSTKFSAKCTVDLNKIEFAAMVNETCRLI